MGQLVVHRSYVHDHRANADQSEQSDNDRREIVWVSSEEERQDCPEAGEGARRKEGDDARLDEDGVLGHHNEDGP